MSHVPFCHLHLHTDRSLLDATLKMEELAKAARELGFKAVAKTDHGNLFGTIKFHDAMRAEGVFPILGCEFYVAPRSRFDKEEDPEGFSRGFHLTVLAENAAGYRNLVHLATKAYTEGFYYNPRIDRELLDAHAEGLIALSGCLSAEVPKRYLSGDPDGARRAAAEHREIFGADNYFIELQEHGLPEDRRLLPFLKDLSREMRIPTVATNDVHYLRPEDAQVHDVFLCIGTRKRLDDENRKRYGADTFYLKSYEEMKQAFPEDEDALRRTLEVADRCRVDLSFAGWRLPPFPIPGGETADGHLARLANEGLRRRLGLAPEANLPEAYAFRLAEELAVIRALGFATYFLIVADLLDWARRKKIPVGPGRGSAVGSLVAYSIGITAVDPLPHGLLFERFLNTARKAMPDIDCDFCEARRGEVIEYLREKYGAANVAQIATFQTMKARRVIRDVGRVLDVPLKEVNRLAELIPPGESDLDAALEASADLAAAAKQHGDLFRYARRLTGLRRDASRHASGVVVADDACRDLLPLFADKQGNVVAQYDMDEVQRLGLIKFDVLGLKTLTMIQATIDRLAERGVRVDFDEIGFDDEATYQLIASGETLGVFQADSEGMRDVMRRLRPKNLDEISLAIAFYRPGAIGHFDDFLARREGRVKFEMHPKIAEVLGDSYGLPIYQEHVLLAARRLADFAPEEADELRAAMAKKKEGPLREYRRKFLDNAEANGIPHKDAEALINAFEQFSRYGFNKSHSIAYAVLAYQTAYLKAHHPAEFLSALLTSEMDKHREKMTQYLGEARRMGLAILPPCVNRSRHDFTTEKTKDGRGAIRFGLGAIKNLGHRAVEAILGAREEGGPFQDAADFFRRIAAHPDANETGLFNRRAFEALVEAGAFDVFGPSRRAHLAALDALLSYASEEARRRASGQGSLFGETLPAPAVPDLPEAPLAEVLLAERNALDSYVSAHPLAAFERTLPPEALRRIGPLLSAVEGDDEDARSVPAEVTVCAIVVGVERRTDRNQETYARVLLEDFSGTAEALVFARLYRETESLWKPGKAVKVRLAVEADDGLSLVARKAAPLAASGPKREIEKEARRPPRRKAAARPAALHIRLAEEDGATLARLSEALRAAPGDVPVFLHVGPDDAVFDLGLKVAPDEDCLAKLRRLADVSLA